MRLSWIRAGLAFLTAFAALQASAQETPPAGTRPQAPPEFTIDAGGWKGGAFGNPDNQQFGYCGISKPYDNGLVLIFQINPAGNLNVGVLKQGWGLAEGEKGPARIVVDDKFDQTFEAVPGSADIYIIPTGQNAALFDAIGRGNNATITIPKGEFAFPLRGTMAGLTALRNCIEKARDVFAGGQPAGAGGTGGAAGAGAGPQQEVVGAQGYGITVQGMASLLNTAGFTGFGMADPASIRRDPLQLNHAWELDQTGEVIGGVHQEPRGDDVEIDQFAKRYLEIMKSSCPTDWTQETQEATIMEAYATKYADIACTLNGQAIVASLVFTLDDNYYSVFFHQSVPANKDKAVAATHKLGDFITSMMQKSLEPAPTETPAPTTDAPATDAPATDAPAPETPPATDAPATDAPATDAPAETPAP